MEDILEKKNKIIAGLLAIFLGTLGIHKFYLNNAKPGLIMLICTLLGFLLFGIPTLIVAVIALVEGILYMVKSDDEFNSIYVQNKKDWF